MLCKVAAFTPRDCVDSTKMMGSIALSNWVRLRGWPGPNVCHSQETMALKDSIGQNHGGWGWQGWAGKPAAPPRGNPECRPVPCGTMRFYEAMPLPKHLKNSVTILMYDDLSAKKEAYYFCNIFLSKRAKHLHISGSLLFFVLLLRFISNLLISDERSLENQKKMIHIISTLAFKSNTILKEILTNLAPWFRAIISYLLQKIVLLHTWGKIILLTPTNDKNIMHYPQCHFLLSLKCMNSNTAKNLLKHKFLWPHRVLSFSYVCFCYLYTIQGDVTVWISKMLCWKCMGFFNM